MPVVMVGVTTIVVAVIMVITTDFSTRNLKHVAVLGSEPFLSQKARIAQADFLRLAAVL